MDEKQVREKEIIMLQLQKPLPDKKDLVRIGIFGPTLSGKTTLAINISRQFWTVRGIKTFVLDVNPETADWGPQALVFKDEQAFWEACWKTQGNLIIADDATKTINRNPDLNDVFTRIRHNYHSLIVAGHSAVNLVPMMREQIVELYLFRQSKKGANIWVEEFMDERLLAVTTLKQYEFVHTKRFGDPVKHIVSLPKNIGSPNIVS